VDEVTTTTPADTVETRPPTTTPKAFEGLAAGDGDADTSGPVEQHLITIKAEPKTRWATLTGDDPIIPPWLTDWTITKQKAVRARRITGRACLYGLINTWQLGRAVGWILRGLGGWSWRLTKWLLDVEGHPTRGDLQAGDWREYSTGAILRSRRQKYRCQLLGVSLAALTVALAVLWLIAPWTRWGCRPWSGKAGWVGRPEEIRSSPRDPPTSPPAHRPGRRALAEVVDAKTAKVIREDSKRLWQSGFVDVRGGHRIRIVLPGSAVSADLVQHEQRIASALGRPEDCAIIETLPHITTGHFHLYVFDKPMLGGKPSPGPLVKAKRNVMVGANIVWTDQDG
jgi:hypothetical protein